MKPGGRCFLGVKLKVEVEIVIDQPIEVGRDLRASSAQIVDKHECHTPQHHKR
jgi:hypothetical protein